MSGDGVGLNADSSGKKIRTQSRVHTRVWVAATTFYIGEFVRPTAANGRVYRMTATSSGNNLSGASHATTQPTWPTTASATVVDNQITWTEWGSDLFHDQYTINVDESTGNAARVLNAAPAATDYGLVTRPAPVARTMRTVYAQGITGVAAEAIIATGSVNNVSNFATATTGNPQTVTSGKTYRIQAMILTNRLSAATINWTRFNLRAVSSGTASATSPIIASVQATAPAATASAGTTVVLPFADGLELPSGASFALCHVSNSATGTNDFMLVGYEY